MKTYSKFLREIELKGIFDEIAKNYLFEPNGAEDFTLDCKEVVEELILNTDVKLMIDIDDNEYFKDLLLTIAIHSV